MADNTASAYGDLTSWARREVELVCNKESGPFSDYYKACCESALKAYESLIQDNHSGMSWSITRSILMQLMEDKPLSPVTEEDFSVIPTIQDDPAWLASQGLVDIIPCSRMRGLYKYIYKDGTILYKDINRVSVRDISTDTYWTSGFMSNLVSEMYPITMPYIGEKYIANVEENRSISCKDDYDGIAFKTLTHPDGSIETIDRFFIEDAEGNWNEVGETTYKLFLEGEPK